MINKASIRAVLVALDCHVKMCMEMIKYVLVN